jgi:hypothetical protein
LARSKKRRRRRKPERSNPGGEFTLVPEPATIPTSEHATTNFQTMFFPDLGRPLDVTAWDDARWLELLRTHIAALEVAG